MAKYFRMYQYEIVWQCNPSYKINYLFSYFVRRAKVNRQMK